MGYLEELRRKIDQKIKEIIGSLIGPENFYDGMEYHITTGGKRIRPIFAFLVGKSFGVEDEKIFPLAISAELLHQFTLVHDDIEDGDTVRRNKPTVWIKYGMPHGINIGDGMREVAFTILLKGRDVWGDKLCLDLVMLADYCLLNVLEGQTMDMNFRERSDVSEEEYIEMVKRKTGGMLILPIVGAAMIAGQPKKVLKKLKEYCYLIGTAFQIKDDMLDFTKGKGRGIIGSDVREGKRSLLVVYSLRNVSKEKRNKLLSILNKHEGIKKDVKWVYDLFTECGAFDYASRKCEELVEKAKGIIEEHIPESKEKRYLLELTELVIKRKR